MTAEPEPVVQPGRPEPARGDDHAGGGAGAPRVRAAALECAFLSAACLLTWWLATGLLSRVHSVSEDDDLLGGMWAVLATIFVLRDSLRQSLAAAVSRMTATGVSFVLGLAYLIFLPFHVWALAVLIGLSAFVVIAAGRPDDAVTAGITTAVILVAAAITPQHAWQQPILRLADTVLGVGVGALAAWTCTWAKRASGAARVQGKFTTGG